VLEIAAARSADTRLGIALLGLALFGAVATTRGNGRISVVPMLVLCLIVAGWLFGATLVWGTGYATKIRWSASWTYNGDAWQWTALLVIALIGVGCLGLGVRAFAGDALRRGWTLSALSGAAFAAWSAVVRYPTAGAVIASVAGAVALPRLVRRPVPAPSRREPHFERQRAAIPLLLLAIVIGFAWAYYAFARLVIGPEGVPAPCNCWADRYDDWQYQWQFFVAIAGAGSLVATAVAYMMKSRIALRLSTATLLLTIAGGAAFFVTGTA